MIKSDYIHTVPYRWRDNNGREQQVVLRGTADQIAERLAEHLRIMLSDGRSEVITIEPIGPQNIFELNKE